MSKVFSAQSCPPGPGGVLTPLITTEGCHVVAPSTSKRTHNSAALLPPTSSPPTGHCAELAVGSPQTPADWTVPYTPLLHLINDQPTLLEANPSAGPVSLLCSLRYAAIHLDSQGGYEPLFSFCPWRTVLLTP